MYETEVFGWLLAWNVLVSRPEILKSWVYEWRAHPRSRRSSSLGGRKRTSASSTTWSCRPSSPGGPCTSSRWGWRKGRCPRCGRTTPRGRAGRTPPCGWADSASSDGPAKRTVPTDSGRRVSEWVAKLFTFLWASSSRVPRVYKQITVANLSRHKSWMIFHKRLSDNSIKSTGLCDLKLPYFLFYSFANWGQWKHVNTANIFTVFHYVQLVNGLAKNC